MFGIGTSWIYISIHDFGHTPVLLALLGTGLFIGGISLFTALQCGFNALCWHKNSWVISFPCCWVLQEWLRSHLLTGFPWLLLGYSQINSPLAGYIPIIGSSGIALLISLTASLLVFSIWQRRWWLLILVAIIWLGGWGLKQIHWTQPTGRTLIVSLIQGNIDQDLKWSPHFLNATLARYAKLTLEHRESDLIVCPGIGITAGLSTNTTVFN